MHAIPAAGTDAPMSATAFSSIRAAGLARILRTATACGWRSAGVRAGHNLAGDAEGFPNLILAHGGAGRVWFLTVRAATGSPPAEVQIWGETLIRAGAVWRHVSLPGDVDQLCIDLADTVRPT